jgi:carboxypeptidase Taq
MIDVDSWAALDTRMRELADLAHVRSLLGWDKEAKMPLHGAEARARQQATMRGIYHERITDPRLGELLDELADEPDPARAAMVRNIRRLHERAAKLPVEFAQRVALAESRGSTIWRVARSENDFASFLPALEEIVALKREEAELVGYEHEAYDALLDEYEPGMTAARLEPLLGELRDETLRLLGEIQAAGPLPPAPFDGKRFAVDAQWAFTIDVLRDLGFDLDAGRQDVSAHPFSSSAALRDVRLTTRIDELDPFSGLFATIHECGHGLYEQGFDPRYEDTPIAEAPSHGIHESQSRLWENIVGRSRAFWERYTPLMRDAFPEAMAGVEVDDVYRHVNRVEPSLIRVEADEVTYNLHIAVRFRLELAMLRGDVSAAGLPTAWNDAYEELLGIRPPTDADGVMQDIHWSSGSIGYFPSYSLGNLYSAVLWAALAADHPDVDERIAAGDLGVVLEWMREHVHRRGYLEESEDTVRRATGHGLEVQPLMRYLRARRAPLYGLA